MVAPPNENKFSKMKNTAENRLAYDESIIRELTFCCSTKDAPLDKLRDSLTLFRGTSHKTINAILHENLKNFAFDDMDLLKKRVPELSIVLWNVYGFESYDRRKTLCYVHMHEKDYEYNPISTKKSYGRKLRGENTSSAGFTNDKSMYTAGGGHSDLMKDPAYRELLPYDELHNNCERQRLHFVSRIAIISSSKNSQQRFYEGHKNKISCMAVHPSKYIIATGESNANPSIHIWDSRDCATRTVLETSHGAGIINMAFSSDGSLIISLGIDTFYSIQVTNWEQEEIIAFKNSSTNTLLDVVINPFNKNEFATCGYHKVQIWSIVGKSLLVKENTIITEGDKNQLPYITCINY